MSLSDWKATCDCQILLGWTIVASLVESQSQLAIEVVYTMDVNVLYGGKFIHALQLIFDGDFSFTTFDKF
jgi:hypothetical protein